MKTVLIGVTGGIACYKAVEIVNDLSKRGFDVHVIMTKNAREFVTPLTFQTLSHNKVITDMFDKVDKWDTEHISLAKAADIFVIVPCSANVIGKVANGIADDMLTTTVMATKAPKLIAPAMNTAMLENPIVQQNIAKLRDFGYYVLNTGTGLLACGDLGSGKLLPWNEIVEEIVDILDINNSED